MKAFVLIIYEGWYIIVKGSLFSNVFILMNILDITNFERIYYKEYVNVCQHYIQVFGRFSVLQNYLNLQLGLIIKSMNVSYNIVQNVPC